ncbi:hypothetical protein WN51_06072 [Melipona quadrifasciata]|uniref:Uncharacterized protein n=1 Tax=Melipona quadrifasciata TaxID=166423 RepID=A0A0N0U2V3_9HYME|nr:hypothetical protein WN51_06072 [Melipona quadrifasciata]
MDTQLAITSEEGFGHRICRRKSNSPIVLVIRFFTALNTILIYTREIAHTVHDIFGILPILFLKRPINMTDYISQTKRKNKSGVPTTFFYGKRVWKVCVKDIFVEAINTAVNY